MNVDVAALTVAATDVGRISTRLAQASVPATALTPAAADEISVSMAELFGLYGAAWQQFAAAASQFGVQFAALLQTGADTYTQVELGASLQFFGTGTNPTELTEFLWCF